MRTTLLLPLALFAAAGCFRLSRDSPPLQQYVLGAAVSADPSAVATGAVPIGGVTIGLRRLDLAPYLAIPAVVVRRGAHEIFVSDFHRWGEDPGEGISRAVAGYLGARTFIRAVDVAPWSAGARHDYLVQLHVARFEGVAPADSSALEGEVHLLATWEILRPMDGAVLARGRTEHRTPEWAVGDYAALVTALDRALNELAGEVATCVGQLAAGGATTAGADARPAAVLCNTRTARAS